MKETITYSAYTCMPMKAKMSNLQRTLRDQYGYDLEITCKRDKKTIKALMDFQKKHGLTPNGHVCERTLYELDMKKGD